MINISIFGTISSILLVMPKQSLMSLQEFSANSWENRLADNEEEDDGNITDPELIAEKEYALEHGTEFDMNLIGERGLSTAAGGQAGRKCLVLNHKR